MIESSTPPAPHRTARTSARLLPATPMRGQESAFSLIELLVVMLIIGVIGAIAVGSAQTSHRNGALAQARTVARTLGEGVQQFQRDHGERLPGQPGTAEGAADWNNGWVSPVDAANGNKPYVKQSALEPLTGGSVALANSSGAVGPGSANAGARVKYVPDPTGSPDYALVVSTRRGETWQVECFVSNVEAPGALAGGASRKC